MADLEVEAHGWHGLFGMRYQPKTMNLAHTIMLLPEYGAEQRGDVVSFNTGSDCIVFFQDYRRDPGFLKSEALNLAADDRFSLEMMGNTALEFTICSSSREQNYRTRDDLLSHLEHLQDVEFTKKLEEYEKDKLTRFCKLRWLDESEDVEPIEFGNERKHILWHYYGRKRQPSLDEITKASREFNIFLRQIDGITLYRGVKFKEGNQDVGITLSEQTEKYVKGNLLLQTGKELDVDQYTTMAIAVAGPNKELCHEYMARIKEYFAEYDLQKIKAPRKFIEQARKMLELNLMF